jgi:hypothetical protein
MGRTAYWIKDNLYWLLNEDIGKLDSRYPRHGRNKLIALRRYHLNKLKKDPTYMPPKPEGEPTPEPIGKLYKTWEVSAFNKTTEEWETTTNHGYEYSQTPEDIAEVFEPAVAAKITPTKRKRAERMGKQILVFGDSQIGYHRVYDQEGKDSLIPTHSESALSVLTQINAHERPDTVVNVSDTVDLAEFGRFDPQSDSFHRTLSPSFQRAHNLYAQLRSDNPDGHLVEVDSNHTTRVHKNIMKKMPEMYGFKLPGEDYPLMSYYRLANLAPIGVEFIAGYGAAEFVYGEQYGAPGIIFKHGTTTSSGAGATVRKEAIQNPNHHVVRGHGHSYESIAQTTRNGDQLYYTQIGTTCDNKGVVPSYGSSMDDFGMPLHKQENWQNQLMMIEDFEDGTYNFNMINIANGIAKYKGVRYDGNE